MKTNPYFRGGSSRGQPMRSRPSLTKAQMYTPGIGLHLGMEWDWRHALPAGGGFIETEAGDMLVTEDGDNIIFES